MNKMLILNSSDNIKCQIDPQAALKSGLIKELIQDFEENEIPMPTIQGEILKKVIEYLDHYKTTEPKKIPHPRPSTNLSEVTDEWDITFLNLFDLDATFDLVEAANYMDIKSLVELSCAKIASLLKEKPPGDLNMMFNIESDLSEEELKEYKDYQNFQK